MEQTKHDSKSRLDQAHEIERMLVKKMDEEMKQETKNLNKWKEIVDLLFKLDEKSEEARR
jgi:hypothetical protein